MLDKSIPYFDVIMYLPFAAPLPPVPALPDGYAYTFYAPGDAKCWCEIETSVDEFDSVPQAGEYFRRVFASQPGELSRRMVFVQNPSGDLVANASAWWGDDPDAGRIAMLHWVAVRPGEQGRGLGRAVTAKALSLFPSLGPEGDIWLTTQTWSHAAIDLYLSLGFRAHRLATPMGHKNGFDGASRVLKDVMRPKSYALFMYTSLMRENR